MRQALVLLLLWVPPSALAAKSHIEYGAGNYRSADEASHPEKQLANLYITLDELMVSAQPNEPVTFYVNDKEEGAAQYATDKLKEYADKKGYKNVTILFYPGDILTKKIWPRTTTAHFKNPDGVLLDKNNVKAFQYLADHSETGLELTTYFFEDWNSIKGEFTFVKRGPGMMYRFPTGGRAPQATEAFLIAPKTAREHADWLVKFTQWTGDFRGHCTAIYRAGARYLENLTY